MPSTSGASSTANPHFHVPADKMKICLITNNYLLSMAFVFERNERSECSRIIIIIGENLLFYLTILPSRSLSSVTWGATQLWFLCNCNFIISINVVSSLLRLLPFRVLHSMYHIIHQNITIDAE